MHAYASMIVFVDTLYHYTLTAKVETQDFASHKQGFAKQCGEYVAVVAAFFARETQDFASLQADAIVVIYGKLHDGMRRQTKVETQKFCVSQACICYLLW